MAECHCCSRLFATELPFLEIGCHKSDKFDKVVTKIATTLFLYAITLDKKILKNVVV